MLISDINETNSKLLENIDFLSIIFWLSNAHLIFLILEIMFTQETRIIFFLFNHIFFCCCCLSIIHIRNLSAFICSYKWHQWNKFKTAGKYSFSFHYLLISQCTFTFSNSSSHAHTGNQVILFLFSHNFSLNFNTYKEISHHLYVFVSDINKTNLKLLENIDFFHHLLIIQCTFSFSNFSSHVHTGKQGHFLFI